MSAGQSSKCEQVMQSLRTPSHRHKEELPCQGSESEGEIATAERLPAMHAEEARSLPGQVGPFPDSVLCKSS